MKKLLFAIGFTLLPLSAFAAATTTAPLNRNSNTISLPGTTFINYNTSTSTFYGGIKILSGCFQLSSGACAGTGGGSATLSGGSPNTLTYWTAGTTVGATSSPTVGYITATTTTASKLPYASSTAFTSNLLYAGAGSTGAPSHTFTGDEDTGMYNSGTNRLGFSVGGSLITELTSHGQEFTYTLANCFAHTGISYNSCLWNDDGNIGSLALRTDQGGAASAGEFNIYNSSDSGNYTSGANYERATLSFQNEANVLDIGTEAGGIGIARPINFIGGNVGIASTSPGSLFAVNGIANFTTATTSFYGTGGMNLKSGCFAVAGTCIASTATTLSGGSPNTITYWTSPTAVSATGSPTVGYIFATSTTATSTFLGALSISTTTTGYDNQFNLSGNGEIYDANPQLLSTLASSSMAGSGWVRVRGHTAFMVSDSTAQGFGTISDNFNVIDVRDPFNPALMTRASTTQTVSPEGFEPVGRYAYLTGVTNHAVSVWDISNLRSISQVGFVSSSTALASAEGIAIGGKYAYVVNALEATGAFTVLDISDPKHPYIISSISSSDFNKLTTVILKGTHVYASSRGLGELIVIDVSDPYNPFESGKSVFVSGGGTGSLAIDDKYAYMTSTTTLAIIDVSDPSNSAMPIIGSVTIPGTVSMGTIKLAERYAYVADYTFGSSIRVFDVSSSTKPYQVGQSTALPHGSDDIDIVGDLLYATSNDNPGGLYIFKIAGLRAPGANIGTLYSDSISVNGRATLGNVYVQDGITAGQSGIYTSGQITSYGSSTAAYYVGTTTATSSLSGGLNITSGCFAISSICVTSGSASLSGGSPNTLTYWTSGTAVSATGSPTVGYIFATSTTPSTFINASTTAISGTGPAYFGTGGSNVGIATTSSGGRLTVDQSADANALMLYAPNVSNNAVFNIQGCPIGNGTGNGKAFQLIGPTDAFTRVVFYCNPAFGFGMGPGNATRDVFLSRETTNQFRISSDASTGSANLDVNGKIGIASSTPSGSLSINTSSGVIPFIVSSSTPQSAASSTLFEVDKGGAIITGGGVPALSSCGTGPSFDGHSTDQAGTITPGSAASGCTVTFSTPKSASPHCIVTEQTMSLVNALTYSESSTALTVSQTGLSSKFDYFCSQ